jgi:hypothetical protein
MGVLAFYICSGGPDGHVSGGRCGYVPPRCPCPVEEYRERGGEQRGPGRDEGDLPAGHAAGDDGVDMDRGRDRRVSGTVRPRRRRRGESGGCGVSASRAPASPAKTAGMRRMWFMVSP